LRKYEYSQIDRLAPKPARLSRAVRRGIWLHKAIEVYHQGQQWPLALGKLYKWAVDHGVAEEVASDIRQEVDGIMQGYIHHWRLEPWKVILAEKPLIIQTKAGDTIRATIDMIIQDKMGANWIVEHKSTRQIPSSAWRAIDPQTALQAIVAAKAGFKIEGIIFNYLLTELPKIPRIKQNGEFYASNGMTTNAVFRDVVERQWPGYSMQPGSHGLKVREMVEAERGRIVNDGAFFQRYPVMRPVEQLKSTARDVQAVLGQIKEAQSVGYFPRSLNPMTCERFCSYQQLCSTEYATGKRAEYLRDTEYIVETDESQREGR
jgi:hypothetical protein